MQEPYIQLTAAENKRIQKILSRIKDLEGKTVPRNLLFNSSRQISFLLNKAHQRAQRRFPS